MLKEEAAEAALPSPGGLELDPEAPFWKLCQQIGGMDAFLDRAAAEGFDPAAQIGSLLDASAEKVEKLVSMIEDFELKAAQIGERAKFLARRAATARNTAAAIYRYAEESMRAQKLQEMPGVERKLYFRATDDVVVPKREPTPQDFLRFGGDLVKMTPEHYEWRLPELKRLLKADAEGVADLGELKPNDHLQIGERLNVSIVKKKTKKEKQG
jgi:hypothetical protein